MKSFIKILLGIGCGVSLRRVSKSEIVAARFRKGHQFKIQGCDPVTELDQAQVELACSGRLGGEGFPAFADMTQFGRWSIRDNGFETEQAFDFHCDACRMVGRYLDDAKPKGHPIEIWLNHWERYRDLVRIQAQQAGLPEPPDLAVSTAAGVYDIALWDALGQRYGRNPLELLDEESLGRSLAKRIRDLTGGLPSDVILANPKPSVFVWLTSGIGAPVLQTDIETPAGDGRSQAACEYLDSEREGIHYFKVKLNGKDTDEDLPALQAHADALSVLRPKQAHLWIDFNEGVLEGSSYIRELLSRLDLPENVEIFGIEQPFSRDAETSVSEIADLVDVYVDEGISSWKDVVRFHQMGYTGICIKACRGLSDAILAATVAKNLGMKVVVMDLTVRGRGAVAAANLAAYLVGNPPLEFNGVAQFFQDPDGGMAKTFPGIFQVKNGAIDTSRLGNDGFFRVIQS